MLYAVASAEPNRGWGGPIALLAAFIIFRLLMPVGRWVMSKIGNPSPPPALPAGSRLKAQATIGVTDDEPSEPEVGWWGRIIEVGGVRVRQAQQVWRTGSHELPPAEAEDDLYTASDRDPGIDLPLDDEPEDDEDEGETVEEYIARARDLKVPYNQIVRVVMEYYDLSASTAKRRIRNVDADRRG